MQIRSIAVGSQRKVPHPSIDFATVSASVNITANLSPEDNVAECLADLQHLAELAATEHIDRVCAELRPKAIGTPVAKKAASATADTAAKLAAKYGGTKF